MNKSANFTLKINLQVDIMEIVSIFGDRLFAFKYPEETEDEFSRLFDLWNDTEYLEEFFETHLKDLQSGYWGKIDVEEAILDTLDYAKQFEKVLIELSYENEQQQLNGLESVFKPLSNYSYILRGFDKSKAIDNWLRLYALRVDKNVYIVTGGAIKLTQKMQDRDHTNNELGKLNRCRNYLLDIGIVDVDGVIEEIES